MESGAILVVLITILGPVSGAHFNPAVTLARGFTTTFAGIAINHVPVFVLAQLDGAAAGAVMAQALFALPARK
jgi:glycerol uptake facilitator-like aquaporin